ncbi:acyl-ACP--UDP-N-acetylglucosamine O-acyltransferase [Azorhizobium doebereinerae]|uniref:acyl-ACP--UDP-N-acetylglucosamine O-acyltransferase n=1 Tax=Azorhizobium doebereinerae TaxID=281091 RepID=UPI00041C4D3E|nr:acyl-ACP--UDP-N-acetylglucosamine O-acyltransferase [Azorhizobium doebereinerae]
MALIDPTARVADGARLADDVEVGPFCLVGPDVTLEAGVRLISHVNIQGVTTLGARTQVYPFASLGTPPQSVHYKGEKTTLSVGTDCQIREHVTMNTGTAGGRGATVVGNHCMLMTASHVGHDCLVGDHVIFANNATLGGHVDVGDHVFLGGLCAVHQFVRIGAQVMVGGLSGIREDVIPFGYAIGQNANLVGLNVIGMKRRGFSRSDLHAARAAYRDLFFGAGTFAERLTDLRGRVDQSPFISALVSFVDAGGNRALCHPSRGVVQPED